MFRASKKKGTTIIYRIRWALAGRQGHSVSVHEHHMRHRSCFNLKTAANCSSRCVRVLANECRSSVLLFYGCTQCKQRSDESLSGSLVPNLHSGLITVKFVRWTEERSHFAHSESNYRVTCGKQWSVWWSPAWQGQPELCLLVDFEPNMLKSQEQTLRPTAVDICWHQEEGRMLQSLLMIHKKYHFYCRWL